MPNNQSKNEGNDDQVFWAFTMMAAAEYNFPAPPDDKPGWLAMVQSVFNQFVKRYQKEVDDGNCGGGMRWQIYPWLNGWTYKNTASNGGLFHLGARLAMFTQNDTYAEWAEKAYDWMNDSALLDDDGTVNDGMSMTTNPPCKEADRTPWTYNYGMIIAGAAYVRPLSISFTSTITDIPTDVQLHRRLPQMALRNRAAPEPNLHVLPGVLQGSHVRSVRTERTLRHRPRILQSVSIALARPDRQNGPLHPRHHHAVAANLRKSSGPDLRRRQLARRGKLRVRHALVVGWQ